MVELIIRRAKRNEAADLAILDNIAGHGISQWFWQRAVNKGEAEDAYDWGRSRFAGHDVFGWRNAWVATQNDLIVGSVTAYRMPQDDGEVEDIKRDAPAFTPVFELFDEATGSWFIDSLGVYREFRGTGIGRKLFSHAMDQGKDKGVGRAMLVCEDTNLPAVALYASSGFKTVGERPYIDFGNNRKANKWLLMAADLQE